jgi:hypothetical protein
MVKHMDKNLRLLFSETLSDEKGSTLVITMLIMVILTIVSVSLSNTSRTEMQIASNDQFYKIAFHNADTGINVTSRLIEVFFQENFDGIDLPVTTGSAPNNETPLPITFANETAEIDFRNEALGFDTPVQNPTDVDKAKVDINIDEFQNVEAMVDFRNRRHTIGSEVNTSISFIYTLETQGDGPRGSVSEIDAVYRHVEKI